MMTSALYGLWAKPTLKYIERLRPVPIVKHTFFHSTTCMTSKMGGQYACYAPNQCKQAL
jgi:hypothetical protein